MLSVTAAHALRALTYLARMGRDEALRGKELSELSGVPANYLSKILGELKRVGLVAAVRGTGGGYRLQRDPASIRLVEVVRLFDPARADPGCVLAATRPCSDDAPCPAHARWGAVREAYREFLDSTTLEEIADTGTSCPPRRGS